MLFKTVDILGQVLKNQYARIERPRKAQLINEVFAGPMRALRSFYEYLEKNPDYLVAEIDSALENKQKLSDPDMRRRMAHGIVATIVQAVSYSFFQRAATAVSGDVLKEDVRRTVEANGTLAFRLIESAITLDSPAPLSKTFLSAMKQAAAKNSVAMRVLHLQVLTRLYMFRTDEVDKQWLASPRGFGINLATQHAIEYTTSKSKKH